MARYKAHDSILQQLTPADRKAILSIYQHRCLTGQQLYQYFYKETFHEPSSCMLHLRDMVSQRILEEIEYAESQTAFFLDTLGIVIVEALYSGRLHSLYKPGVQTNAKLPKSAQLKINVKNINHQIHLNEFSLNFETYVPSGTPYTYFDEKFMPPASHFMMPDGMIELPDVFLLLEEDMGTEKAGRLAQKWNSYRMFLNDPGPYYREKPIAMLFIIDGVKNPELRIKNVRNTIAAYLIHAVNGKFDVYMGSQTACHEIIKTKFLSIPTPLSFVVSSVENLISRQFRLKFSRPPFFSQLSAPLGYYVRKLSEANKVVTEQGRRQEFLLDIWLDGRLSVMGNIVRYDRLKREVAAITKRVLPYLLVVPSEEWIMSLLQTPNLIDGILPEDIYLTTPERLQRRPWHEALFRIDQLGNLTHFTDKSLRTAVHERRLKRYVHYT